MRRGDMVWAFEIAAREVLRISGIEVPERHTSTGKRKPPAKAGSHNGTNKIVSRHEPRACSLEDPLTKASNAMLPEETSAQGKKADCLFSGTRTSGNTLLAEKREVVKIA